jgi:hypothetical protein
VIAVERILKAEPGSLAIDPTPVYEAIATM